MGTCRICNRMSATDSDHIDCVQRRRIESEDEWAGGGGGGGGEGGGKEVLTERLSMAGDPGDLGAEIRAILDYMAREREGSGRD